MNSLHIAPAAQKDLLEIKKYITEDLENPDAALSTVSKITKTICCSQIFSEVPPQGSKQSGIENHPFILFV